MQARTIYIILFLLFMHIGKAQIFKTSEYRSTQIEQNTKYIKGNIYQKDLLLFIDMLKTTHPAFVDVSKYPMNIDSILLQEYKKLSKCHTKNEFKIQLKSMLSMLKDGHTYVSLLQESNPKTYPVNIFCDEDKFYVESIDSINISVLGEEIDSLNNMPVSKIIKDFSLVIECDNQNELQNKLPRYLKIPEYWQSLYLYSGSTLNIKLKNGTSIILSSVPTKTLISVNKKTFDNIYTMPNSSLFSYKFINEICYFQFNHCLDYNTLLCQWFLENGDSLSSSPSQKEMEKAIASYPKFDIFLDSMFMNMKMNDIQMLVVDVRNNKGGNSALCTQLLAYLYPIDSLMEYNQSIHNSDFLKQHYPALFSEEEKEKEDKINEKLSIFFSINKDQRKIFKGRTIFIQGRHTFSSAGSLVVSATDNQIGLIIGGKSSYRPCNYGDIIEWKLPNTNTEGGISFRYFERPDKSKCDETELIPDVYIHTSFQNMLDGIDPCWEWIMNEYKK